MIFRNPTLNCNHTPMTSPSIHWTPSRCGRLLPLAVLLAAGTVATYGQASHPRLVLTPAPGFSISWDGNNGAFSNPDVGAGPSNNVALASNGTVAFTSSDLGPELGIPFHIAANLNDGLYGNVNSWISGSTGPFPFAALRFPASVNIRGVAWGRDNGLGAGDSCGGTCGDRTLGRYTLQFTQVTGPDGSTPETGDAATGWADLGTVEYLPGAEDATFTSYLRHRFDVAESGNPISATGLRIKVPVGGLAGGTDIDEIEVNPIADPVPPIGNFIEITPNTGFGINWDRNEGKFSTTATPAAAPINDASGSRGATTFGSTELGPALGIPFHRFLNVNDGLYGNAHSWIPDFIAGDAAPFVGINFGGRRSVSSLAWGRDNGDVAGDCCGGTLTDRALGVYVVQVTTAPNPGPSTPEACGPTPDSGWVTVGTIDFKDNHPAFFNSHLRHRFDLTQGGAPIMATGVRIKVPNANSAIDEIEVNGTLALETGAMRLAAALGVTLNWDGNDGQFNNPAVGAGPPANRALASEGTTPFTSSDLGPLLGIPFHNAANLNDGLYGNANSWISANGIGGNSDADVFAGLNFNGTVNISNIAWGRDNGNVGGDCCGGTLTDRALDTYRLQYTLVTAPDGTTPDTGDAATGWQDLGTVSYANAAPPGFNPSLRHRFDVSAGGPIEATGVRIKVGNGTTAIDEIEINAPAGAPPPPSPVGITSAAGYAIVWDGNDGQFQNPGVGARPPANRALASLGSSAFSSSDLGPVLGIPLHLAANLNDGLYGNSKSWISANGIGGTTDPDPFAGVSFNGTVGIRNLAWGRDNGDAAEGTFTDRALGIYTIQITTVNSPDATTPETDDSATGWASVGTVEYRRADPGAFTPHLRHRFDLSAGSQPIEATGVRIKVSNGQMDIDEIEINATTSPSGCCNVEPGFTLTDTSVTSDEDDGVVTVPGFLSNVSAGANEPGQTVTIHVSNDNPALFSVQPAFDASGALTYRSAPGASGSANVSVVATDDGGTGFCGDDTSATVGIVIVIRAVNHCPVAGASSLALLQDTPATFQLAASDVDGDALQYEITEAAAHGTLSLQAGIGSGSYAPAAGYCGPDSFKFRVTDGQCRSDEMTVTITVTCLNRCPTALAVAGPRADLFPEIDSFLVIASNNSNACVWLDGTASFDPDGDALIHEWFLAGLPLPIASGSVATACLDVGSHRLMLAVNDGRCVGTVEIEVEIITPGEAMDVLIAAVNNGDLGRNQKRPLIASLKAASASFDRGGCQSGLNQLQAFINKVRAQVARVNPVLATELIRLAGQLSTRVECPESGEE
jgi:hypothetical protein